MENLKESAEKVQSKLKEMGFTNRVIELADSTRTSQEAADAVGCNIAQIAKSIIFRLKKSNRPLLVIASGRNRINEEKISNKLDDKLGKADADFVREHTGYVIGGVPPCGHKETIRTFIDEDLFEFEKIWAAAGHPKAVFQLNPEELVKITGGEIISVK